MTGQRENDVERIQTVIIGGGQAGLSVGYHLAQRRLPFVILEGHARIGDTWRRRWDSLRLFTAAKFDGLDGLPFPRGSRSIPTKDEMADYLKSYARQFALPVRTGVKVDRVERRGSTYLITAGPRQIEAEHLVIAMANYQSPRVPAFAQQLDPRIVQLHSFDYRSPQQLQDGAVLIVGAGNPDRRSRWSCRVATRCRWRDAIPGTYRFGPVVSSDAGCSCGSFCACCSIAS